MEGLETVQQEPVSAPETTTAEPVSSAPESVRSTIEKAYDALETPAQAAERARDELGRFAPKSESPKLGVNTTPEAAATAVSPASTPPIQSPSSDSQKAELLPPPASWSGPSKELWKDIPQQAKEEIVKYEKGLRRYLTEQSQQIAQARKHYAELDEALTPHRELISQWGVTPAEATKTLLQAQINLDKDPPNTFLDMLQTYGLSPEDLIAHRDGGGRKSNILPEPVQSALDEIRQWKAERARSEQEQAQRHHQTLSQQVIQFAEELGPDGAPLRPYFGDLFRQGLLAPRLERLTAENPQAPLKEILQRAYDAELRASYPDHFERSLQAKAQSARLENQVKQAEQAKRAQVSLSGAPGGTRLPAPTAKETPRQAVERAWETLS